MNRRLKESKQTLKEEKEEMGENNKASQEKPLSLKLVFIYL